MRPNTIHDRDQLLTFPMCRHRHREHVGIGQQTSWQSRAEYIGRARLITKASFQVSFSLVFSSEKMFWAACVYMLDPVMAALFNAAIVGIVARIDCGRSNRIGCYASNRTARHSS